MGRDWISHLDVSLKDINVVDLTPVKSFLERYSTVFNEELGCLSKVNREC